jgi:hypothetical protein
VVKKKVGVVYLDVMRQKADNLASFIRTTIASEISGSHGGEDLLLLTTDVARSRQR